MFYYFKMVIYNFPQNLDYYENILIWIKNIFV